MAKEASKTQYLRIPGTIKWAKVYTPDEYKGAVRWTLNFYPSDKGWEMVKEAGIQKRPKTDKEGGTFINLQRPTTKMIKGSLVYFTPPIIYDEDGEFLVKYVDENNKIIRSYNDKDTVIKRDGEPVLIGNDSEVLVHVSVYPTAMGPGNRLDAITLVDLVHYEKPENEENKETKGPEVKQEKDATPPW